MRDLIHHAATLGAEVHIVDIAGEPDLLGYFSSKHSVIIVQVGMTYAQSRWVLGHECGHAYYGHRCSGPGTHGPAERQADAYAARLLIDPEEFERLERIDADAHWLADEFRVHVDAVHAYRKHCLTRLRGVTYSRSRMGSGQWVHRGVWA